MESSFDDPDYDYAASIAGRAMRSMEEQRIPLTPTNFAIWFQYYADGHDDLRNAVDLLIDHNRPFDSRTNQDLFETYIAPHVSAVVVDTSERLHALMAAAKEFLATAIADNRSQMQVISEVADQGQASVDPKALVAQLMNELARAATRATRLEAGFAEKTRELDVIRDSLSKSEERAKTDTLTGLANRRALDEFLRKAQATANWGVLLLDIDHFKTFNDNFGHGVGDQVLRLMAKVLREKVRTQDLSARYGGEELIAVLPDADLAACIDIAERIRRAIAECTITRRSTGEVLPNITVSIGVAQYRVGEPIADLIERCDRALYLAKGGGRNRVVTENELDRADAAG
ncbi:diguanylate cyclase [Bradyrhizobium sp. GCM10027634]|uniref:GGDEF domain-containing protein n=1 Tax=unclassified Bradyrhizobium TaxID=2631580 RepID=UPI00188C02A7|nr:MULTISPECIES: GGDEF domain-containing protein [unclassified Bradyrhizobium]MDN5005971.1 GGDEF domain-containing protein [Bradyrhizobium sp. WYCCWR 12677]